MRRPVLTLLAALLGPALVTGCAAPTASTPTVQVPVNLTDDPTKTTYASSLDVDLTKMTKTASGLYIRDRVVGGGTLARAGFTAEVTYTGSYVTGVAFDSNVGKSPFRFLINAGQVIKGWDEGVQGMRVGGKRQLVIPPALGYGTSGSGQIPGGTILVFEIELLNIR